MDTTRIEGSTHETVATFGCKVESPGNMPTEAIVYYGTSDPVPNVAEFLLTLIVAKLCNLPAKFSIYLGGRSEYTELAQNYSKRLVADEVLPSAAFAVEMIEDWLGISADMSSFEDVLSLGGLWQKTLPEMAEEMRRVRPTQLRFCYVKENGNVKTVYTDGRWLKRAKDIQVSAFHEIGSGWFAGAAIHYSLRCLSENHPEHIHIVPYGSKGEVYRVYRGSKARFILAPKLQVRPRGADPEWLPLELRTFALILSNMDEVEQSILRERLVSAVESGLLGKVRSINLEFQSKRDYKIEIK